MENEPGTIPPLCVFHSGSHVLCSLLILFLLEHIKCKLDQADLYAVV